MRGTRTGHFRATASLVADLVVSLACLWLLVWVRHGAFPVTEEYLRLQGGLVVLWPTVFLFLGLYGRERRLSRIDTALRVARALVICHLSMLVLVFYSKADFLSRGVMAVFFPLNLSAILFGRALVDRLAYGDLSNRTLVLGTGSKAGILAQRLAEDELHDVIGFLQAPSDPAELEEDVRLAIPNATILGTFEDIEAVVEANAPLDELAVAVESADRPLVRDAVRRCEERGLTIRELIRPLGQDVRKTMLETLGGLDLLTSYPSPMTLPEYWVKRGIDIVGALVGLGLTGAALPFVYLATKLTDPGPIFYSQDRVGQGGRRFRIWKFRTMVVDAENLQADLRKQSGSSDTHFHCEDDPRVTRIGHFLRRTSLDEFPQFWNVLTGEMSLVGPRPLPVHEVEAHEWHYHKRLHFKPGLTCIWQTSGRKNITDFEDIVRMDDYYIRNWSLWLDFRLLVLTIPALLRGSGAR